jgi:general secretion pathway protein K
MVLVLWTLAMLTMLSGYYAVEARIRRNIGHNVLASIQGKNCVRAVLTMVAGNIAAPATDASEAADASMTDGEPESSFRADGTEYRMQFAGRDVRFRIEDERGKLDLNKASEDDIKTLMTIFLNDSERADLVSDSIMDWRDRDKLVRACGAGDETYEKKRPAYRAANGEFLLQQELLLVNGVSSDMFYGPVKWIGKGEEDAEWTGGLSDLVTIYNRSGKVVANLAQPPLAAALEESGKPGPATAAGKGSVFRTVVYVDGLVYRIFWSPGGKRGNFTIHEWQESPEESA